MYYGDEIADVGGNDPDNRRIMRFDDLNPEERTTKEWTSAWAHLRTSRMSLLFGNTAFDILEDDVLHIERTYFDEVTHVVLNRNDKPVAIPNVGMQPETVLAGFLTDDGRLPAYGAVAFTSQR